MAALRSLALSTLLLYTILIFIYAALSFIAPGARSPATALLASLCEPLLRPLRQVLPVIGGHRLLAAGRDRRADGPAHPDRLAMPARRFHVPESSVSGNTRALAATAAALLLCRRLRR